MTDMPDQERLSRRNVVLGGVGALTAAFLAACGGDGDSTGPATSQGPTSTTLSSGSAGGATPTTLAATPECADDDDLTPAQTEGPYFKASSPQRTDIRADAGGTKLRLTGTVVTTSCKPVAQALVDFWQADAGGDYDNAAFGFRGHQFTDAQGRYVLDTVVPGLYPGRTRHIHVKVQAPGGRVLTTQLYFPGETRNASDGIYREECEMAVTDAAGGKNGAFTFVLSG